jgi:pimeloyl-ACP methyl ester carboxylesterase
VSRGYRVLAPDLRGHGGSARTSTYRLAEFADDLADTLPAGADIIIGHSLGGLALSLAVDRLRPARAVYYDPAFVVPPLPPGTTQDTLADWLTSPTAASITAEHPRWSDADVAAEVASISRFDRAVGAALAELAGRSLLPESAVVPSLVLLADPSFVVPPDAADELRRRGFEVAVVADTGPCIHRDDPARFLAALDGWI